MSGGLEFYPVKMQFTDFLIVFITILLISLIASLIPLHQLKNSKQTHHEQ